MSFRAKQDRSQGEQSCEVEEPAVCLQRKDCRSFRRAVRARRAYRLLPAPQRKAGFSTPSMHSQSECIACARN